MGKPPGNIINRTIEEVDQMENRIPRKIQDVRSEFETSNGLCLHPEKGQIPKSCTRKYECWHCGFNEWLDEIKRCTIAKKGLEISGYVLAEAA